MRSSLVQHPVDTSLVILYPVDRQGKRFVPDDDTPDAYIVTVDGERTVITSKGTLIERWKADHIVDSLVYRHTWDEEALIAAGVQENTIDFENKLGQTMDQCKFEMRVPSSADLFSVTAPMDEQEFERVANMKEYRDIAAQHGAEIKAAMRANPDVEVEKLFDAFKLAFETSKSDE